MDNDIEKRLIILEERDKYKADQIGRLTSHFDSERGLSRERGLRVDSAVKTLEILDKILRNGGQGLVMEVDRLKQASSGGKNRLTLLISILAVLVGLFDLLLHYLK